MSQTIAPAAPAVNSTPRFSNRNVFADVKPETEADRKARLRRQYAGYDAYLAEMAEDSENQERYESGAWAW